MFSLDPLSDTCVCKIWTMCRLHHFYTSNFILLIFFSFFSLVLTMTLGFQLNMDNEHTLQLFICRQMPSAFWRISSMSSFIESSLMCWEKKKKDTCLFSSDWTDHTAPFWAGNGLFPYLLWYCRTHGSPPWGFHWSHSSPPWFSVSLSPGWRSRPAGGSSGRADWSTSPGEDNMR